MSPYQQEIINTLQDIIRLLQVRVDRVDVEYDERTGTPRFVISTPESHLLIGENGDRILALNHILKRIFEAKTDTLGNRLNFIVDVNDYQKKRTEDLRIKAKMLAERVKFFQSSVELEPMSSYERMLIHSEFADDPQIITISEGKGRERRVVLKYQEGELKTP